jgi:hypothetical protein
MAVPLMAGLASGVGRIILFYVVLNPPFSQFLTNVTPEEHTLMNKARQEAAVQLFLKRYLFAEVGILNRDPFVEYDEMGNIASSKPAITVAYYPSSPRTIITYDDVKQNNSLVRYEYPSLWVVVSLDGNVQSVIYRCGISYLGNPSGVGSVVSGNDIVLTFLHAGKIPC